MFRILVVDDHPTTGQILLAVAKKLQHLPEFFFVGDGQEALDFLRRLGGYADARLPHLILLDMDMPRRGGLATLSAIKEDPALRMIPVIMFSTMAAGHDVLRCYQAHANAFVQKPTDLPSSVGFMKALESFWINCALLPHSHFEIPTRGVAEAPIKAEASFAQLAVIGTQIAERSADDSRDLKGATGWVVFKRPRRSACEEQDRLLDQFAMAVGEIIELHQQQHMAILEGNEDVERFDLLIHVASEKKQAAKYDYLQHLELHGCIRSNASEQA